MPTVYNSGRMRFVVSFYNETGIPLAHLYVNSHGRDSAIAAAKKLYSGRYHKVFAHLEQDAPKSFGRL